MTNNSSKKKLYLKDLYLIILLGVFVCLWFYDVIIYDNILIHRDLSRYFYPLRKFAAESIKNFHLPLWNPYISCGKPFLAALQAAVFYPVSLVYYILPSFERAFNWYIIIHFFLAGLFMYLLVRHWKLSRPASFFSGIVFLCSGYLSSVITMNTTMSAMVWIPLIFIYYDKTLKTNGVKYIFITSVMLGIQFLAGIPDSCYATFLLLFFYTLGYIWTMQTRKKIDGWKDLLLVIRPLFILAAIYCAFLFLFLFQILPFMELLANSNLSEGRSFGAASKWSLTPLELLGFIIPYIRGNINVPSGFMGPQQWLVSFYMGVPAVIFTALLFFFKPRKKALFFGFVLAGSLFIALGKYTPVYPFLFKYMPGIGMIRYPVKFLYVTTFSLSVLSGIGMDAFFSENRHNTINKITRIFLSINFFITALLGVFLFFWKRIGNYILEYVKHSEKFSGDMYYQHLFVYLNDSRYLCHFFIIFTVTVIAMTLYLNRKISKIVFAVIIIPAIIWDLAGANMGITKSLDRKTFLKVPDTVKFLKDDRSLFRIFQTNDIWELNRTIYGRDYAEGITERRRTFASNTAMNDGIYDVWGYDSIEIKDLYNFILFLKRQTIETKIKLISFLNVKYIMSGNPINGHNTKAVYKDKMYKYTLLSGEVIYKPFYIISNFNSMERAFLADSAVIADDRAVVLGIIKNRSFDPKRTVVIETEGKQMPPEDAVVCENSAGLDIEEYTQILSYKPEEVIIDVSARKKKWLVLSDTYYPGWKAYIDNKNVRIYKADYFLRAVCIDKGRHIVRFVYKPLSFVIGAGVSIITLFVFLAYLFLYKKRKMHYYNS